RAKYPLPTRQKSLLANSSRHHRRHRSTVCQLTSNNERNRAIRCGLGPCNIAVTKTTTAPKYTLRPKNRADGGVTRLRQTAQQKLSRLKCSGPSAFCPPLGLRGYRALCSRPPHFGQPRTRTRFAES